MHVLRLCSVFGVPDRAVPVGDLRFDAVGGMQNHTGHLTVVLDELGVRQTVVTSRPPSQPRTELLGRAATVRRSGWPVPVARQGWALGAARALARGALTDRVDVVHAHLGEDLAVLPLARAAARAHRAALVVTVHMSLAHTLPVRGPRTALLRLAGGALERSTHRSADAVIALAPRLARAAVADGADPARVHVVPSGVDPVLFAAAATDQRGADPFPDPRADPRAGQRPRVVFIGRLGGQKDVASLVRAAARLRADADVVIAGAGPDRPALEALVQRLGVGHRVRLVGHVDHTAVPALLATASVAVQPSRYEELGTSIVEALAAGVPVVATRTGGIPTLLQEGRCGVLVPVGDDAALAGAIDGLLDDDVARSRLAACGREVGEAHAWPVLGARILDLYRSVLGLSAPLRPEPGPGADVSLEAA